MSHNFVIDCVNQSLDEGDEIDDEEYGSVDKGYYPMCLDTNVSRPKRYRRQRKS